MRWFRSGLQSLSGWLTAPAVGARAASGEQMEAIRDAMLAALGEAGAARRPGLAARIRFCREADTLWALRGELMDVSSQLHGEATARKLLARVTALFDNVVPQASCLAWPRRQKPADRWLRH
jgi:hypothetical protein